MTKWNLVKFGLVALRTSDQWRKRNAILQW